MLLKTHSFEFGDFLLDTKEKVLVHQEIRLQLTPKIYQLLLVLLENHGHLLEKEDLINEVWADSFVAETSLTYTIGQLRKILGDDARHPKYIETIPRRGYRFIAEVVESTFETDEDSDGEDINGSKKIATDEILLERQFVVRKLFLAASLFALIFFGFILLNPWPVNEEPIFFERLNFKTLRTNGQSLFTAISPDGSYFAYSDETDEKVSLWLQNIETSEKKQILPPGDVYFFGLVFSNDGNSIYFVRRKQTGPNNADIYRVSALGGIPEKIIKHAEGSISLSPDDKSISFVRADTNTDYTLFIADSDGKNERKLITKKHPETIGANQFSPDGKSIAFAAGHSYDGINNFRLLKLDLESRTETEISSQTFFNIKDLEWMPDGKGLLFTANESPEKPHKLWRLSGETGKSVKLTEDFAKYAYLSLAKTGKNLIAVQFKDSFRLLISSISNPNEKRILASARTADFISDKEIVYSTGDGDLWKIGMNGKGQHQLTNGDSVNNRALISADGKHIYYNSNRSGSKQIWRMDLDGSNKVLLTKKIGGIPKFVSPDGKEILFGSFLHQTIWKVSTDGTGIEKEIWNKRLYDSEFSNDGSRIGYFEYDGSNENQLSINISDFRDKSLIRKISLADREMRPVKLDWLDDNETLLFISRDESGYKLWKQKTLVEPAELIADLGKEQISDFSVSPNGENFLIVSGEWLQDVILIEGFD